MKRTDNSIIHIRHSLTVGPERSMFLGLDSELDEFVGREVGIEIICQDINAPLDFLGLEYPCILPVMEGGTASDSLMTFDVNGLFDSEAKVKSILQSIVEAKRSILGGIFSLFSYQNSPVSIFVGPNSFNYAFLQQIPDV